MGRQDRPTRRSATAHYDASHLLWMTTRAEMEKLYDMIAVDAARAMGLNDYGLG